MNNKNNTGFRMWKSGKKWLISGAVSVTILFGPANLIGAADTISASFSDTLTAANTDAVKANISKNGVRIVNDGTINIEDLNGNNITTITGIKGNPGQILSDVFDPTEWVTNNYPGALIVSSDLTERFSNIDDAYPYGTVVIAMVTTAQYVDENGNKISDDVVKTGNIGDKYTTEQKDIEGYTFKEMGKDSAAVSGNFTDKAQTVTYVYTKNPVAAADVTAKYVDTEGNKISDDVVNSGNIGDKYTTEQKDIEGYTFKEMGKDSAAVSGDFTDKAQTVTYVYTKDKVNPVTPTPADNKPSHKEDTHKSVLSSSTHDTLPETGENERMTLMSVGTGLILLIVALIASIFRFKKFKNNK